MNGKLQAFEPARLIIKSKEEFMKPYLDMGFPREEVEATYDRVLCEDVWLNDEYQVNIFKQVEHGFKGIGIWHLSIKRIDREPIHDWRDLQQIKNMLVGPEHEAIEVYPSESRLIDSANQYHLFAFHSLDGNPDIIPQVPIGWDQRFVTDESINDSKNRPFNNEQTKS